MKGYYMKVKNTMKKPVAIIALLCAVSSPLSAMDINCLGYFGDKNKAILEMNKFIVDYINWVQSLKTDREHIAFANENADAINYTACYFGQLTQSLEIQRNAK